MNLILQTLSGPSGKISSQRVSCLTFVLTVCFCIIYTTITGKTFPVIPESVIAGLVGVLGIKAYQTGKENKKEPSKPSE